MKQKQFLSDFPDLVKQIHPTRNVEIDPSVISAGSKRKLWWIIYHWDESKKKIFVFEWEATIANRTILGAGCPFTTGRKVFKGYNDLYSNYPDLCKELHPTKNGDFDPSSVLPNSDVMLWWLLPYDDLNTGKHFDFEWQASLSNRVSKKSGCPYLNGASIWPGYNDLESNYPNLAKEFHRYKNGDLTPATIACNSNKMVWWFLRYFDENQGCYFDFEWQDTVTHRTHDGRGCPFLSNKKVFVGYNDFATTHAELVNNEWDFEKNTIKPTEITYGSKKKVWWKKQYYDEAKDKMFVLSWEASPNQRQKGESCPYLCGKKVLFGFNDLKSCYPDIAKEFDSEKNPRNITPENLSAFSNKEIWWKRLYFDKELNKEFVLCWKASVYNRTKLNADCPYFHSTLLRGFNDLKTRRPLLTKEFDKQKNDIDPSDVLYNTTKEYWWKIEVDGHLYEWKASAFDRSVCGIGCPYLSGTNLEKEISLILLGQKVNFQKEKSFADLKSEKHNCYRYDCYLYTNNMLIECDGKQHFENSIFFYANGEFEQRIKADNIKNTYAFLNNMPLLRIPYTYLGKNDKIKLLIEYFLETKQIPQEIIDFYSQFDFSNYVSCVEEYHKKLDVKDAA